MRALYKSLGDDFSASAENAMRAWLADNPQGKFGKHEYALDQFGLTEALRIALQRRAVDAFFPGVLLRLGEETGIAAQHVGDRRHKGLIHGK